MRLPLLGLGTGLEVTALCLTDPDLTKRTWILAGSKSTERRRDGSWVSLQGGHVFPMWFLSHGGDDTVEWHQLRLTVNRESAELVQAWSITGRILSSVLQA